MDSEENIRRLHWYPSTLVSSNIHIWGNNNYFIFQFSYTIKNIMSNTPTTFL